MMMQLQSMFLRVDNQITIRVQRIDRSRLGELQKLRQPLTRTVRLLLLKFSTRRIIRSLMPTIVHS